MEAKKVIVNVELSIEEKKFFDWYKMKTGEKIKDASSKIISDFVVEFLKDDNFKNQFETFKNSLC